MQEERHEMTKVLLLFKMFNALLQYYIQYYDPITVGALIYDTE
jgi:hypothetical protein